MCFHSQYCYYSLVVNKPIQVLCMYKTTKVEILSLFFPHEEVIVTAISIYLCACKWVCMYARWQWLLKTMSLWRSKEVPMLQSVLQPWPLPVSCLYGVALLILLSQENQAKIYIKGVYILNHGNSLAVVYLHYCMNADYEPVQFKCCYVSDEILCVQKNSGQFQHSPCHQF